MSKEVAEPELKHRITSLLVLQDHFNLLRNTEGRKAHTLVADLQIVQIKHVSALNGLRTLEKLCN